MVRTTQYEDPSRLSLINYLRKHGKSKKAPIWVRVADDLSKSRKDRAEINLEKINKLTKDKDTIVVAGKVLGSGSLDHTVTIASFKIADSAKDKVLSSKGSVVSIKELAETNPAGTNVKILC